MVNSLCRSSSPRLAVRNAIVYTPLIVWPVTFPTRFPTRSKTKRPEDLTRRCNSVAEMMQKNLKEFEKQHEIDGLMYDWIGYCSRRRNVQTHEKYLGCGKRKLLDYCCFCSFLPLRPPFVLPRPSFSVPCSSGYAPAALSRCSKFPITLTRS